MKYEPPSVQPRSQLKWAAVDLDGTIAEGIWTPENPTSLIGRPISANVKKLLDLDAQGWKIAIHTSRPWHDYERIEMWLNHWDIPWKLIVCGKLLAGIYVDDRAVHADDSAWSHIDWVNNVDVRN